MKRSKPLGRKSPFRRKPPRRLKGPGANPAYLERVRGLPCVARQLGLCMFGIRAHHAFGVRGKADDSTAVPLCLGHHLAWHDHNGDFRGWSREKRQEFANHVVGVTRALLAGRTTGATRGPA